MNCDYVDPVDGAPLHADEGGGCLVSESGRRYPVVDGIPRFCEERYAAAFGRQWLTYSATQLDRVTKTTLSRDRLRRALGGSFEPVEGGIVLEVGSGAGRFTEILAERAGTLYTSDLSRAIEANRANNRQFGNVCFAQADIYSPPFEPGRFDAAVVLGVIQHTPDPLAAMRCVVSRLKQGGRLCIDFYRLRASFVTRLGLHATRWVLTRMAPEAASRWAQRLFAIFDPLHRVFARNLVGYLLLTRVSPIVSYYHGESGLSDAQKREWGRLDTHDQLTDRYKHLFTERRVRRLCEACGLDILALGRAGNGFEVLARRR